MATLTSASSVMEGGSIDFTLTLDASASTATSYQWTVVFGRDAPAQNHDFESLSGVFVVAASEREQTFTITTRLNPASSSDRTFTVAILDSMNEEVVESGLITLEDTEGQASFIISSTGYVDTPIVGDELTVNQDAADPDGNGEGIFTYQWYVVGGGDIAGATETSYTITETGQIIGVRVSYTDSEGFDETATAELSVASYIVDPSTYEFLQDDAPNDANTIAGTSAHEVIEGGNNDDTITTGGGNDIIVGGYGRDTITLSDDGAETVVYRFSSDAVTDSSSNTGWIAIDGADTINNFDRGTDKLVFVDVADNPVDLAGFLAGGDTFNVRLDFDPNDGNVLTGVTFQFIGRGLPERAGSETDANADTHSGRWLRINYKDEDKVTIFNPDGSTTDEGAELVGEGGAHYDSSSKLLTDFALLPNYFRATGEDFADGLRLIKEGDISVGSIAPIVERSEYELVQVGDGSGDDTVPSTLDVVDELIQGGNGDDRLGTSDGTDIIIGGYGQDFITLGTYSNRPAGHEETVVYRFSSDGDWTAIDGTDTINRFERGIDKLVLVDVADNPIDLATFLASADQFNVRLVFTDIAQLEMGGIIITFPEVGFANGPGTGDGDTDSGNELRVFFTEAITVFNPNRTVTEEGADFIGENGIYFDASTSELTDFSILPNFFGLELQDGLRLIEASDLGVAITDFPATYVIDDADSGEAEHITDTVGLHVGSTVYARIVTHDPDASGDPSYQWKRGGVDIVGATDAAYTLVLADEDESLTVAVTYRNDISETDETFTSAAVFIPHNEGVSDFVIASNGDVNAPVVGDVLRVDRGTDDPDGNGDGVLSYQWFVMGGDDIAGATSHTYTIAQAGQIIGVRVTYIDGDGYSETAAPVLNIASQDVSLSDYFADIQIGDGDGDNTLVGTSADEFIQGGDDDDTITTGGGNDIVAGGNGRDRITLSDNGAETIIYHFSSDGTWTATDGGDLIHNFERGVDKLVLVDVANDPIDLATLLQSENEFVVTVGFASTGGDLSAVTLAQLNIIFPEQGYSSDLGGEQSGTTIQIYFKTPIDNIVNNDNSVTDKGAKFFGVGGAGFDFTTGHLTDFSLLPNYFKADYEGFEEGFQVIAPNGLDAIFAPPVLDPSDHTLVKDGDGSGEDTLAGTSADEIIQGGNNDDVITTGGGDDIVIGGYGRDRITLDDGVETIVYRFASPVTNDDKWTAVDGADTVRNFKRGVDKLVFVDVGETPVDLATFITLANATHGITRLEVELELIDNGNVLRGVKFKFSGNGFDDGPGSDDSSGKWLRIYFEETVTLFNPDGSITEEGIKLIGENGAGFNADTHLLTDFALLSEYFHDRFDVTTEGQLGTAITDVDAVYVIDDSNTGAAEHITDRSGLLAGSTLYARVLSNDPDTFNGDGDPSYQWKRNGVDILGATGAAYTLSEFDEGESLTVIVTYRNDVSNTFVSATSAAVQILDNEGQASFTITTNGDINALKVGDILKASRDTADPDGDGTFTYQWFTAHGGYISGPVREIDIEGATGNTYRILDAGQTIGVRVTYTDGDGFSEVVSSEFTAGSPIFEAITYTSIDPQNRESLDNLLRTFADELGQTGNDIIYLGDTADILNPPELSDDVAETIIYRFSSDGRWVGVDPDSRFNNFERGVDRLMLVDVGDNPVDLATFLESEDDFTVELNFDFTDGESVINGIGLRFHPDRLHPDGNIVTIQFKDPITIADSSFNLAPQSELFVGVDRAGYNINTGQLTDLSLLPNYFGVGFDDGLQVVASSAAADLFIQAGYRVSEEVFRDISDDDTLVGTPSNEIHRSGDGDDRIVTNGGDDIVIGGDGVDNIILGDDEGAETIVYRFSSDGTWTGVDGGDRVSRFEPGIDKLVLIDVADDPIDFATFLESEDEFTTRVVFDGTIDDPAGLVLTGLTIVFSETEFINVVYKTPIEGVFNPDDSVSDIGAKFLGVDGAGYDRNTGEITDFSLLPNYFGEGFDEGLQVIARSDLNLEGSSFAVPSGHTLVKNGDGDNSDRLLIGTSADEFIVGGNRHDTITTNGGDDIVIGGYGIDIINLGEGDGAETIIYRFSSDDDWTATDGYGRVHNFERGVDTLMLVDVGDNPMDLAALIERGDEFKVQIKFDASSPHAEDITITGVWFTFPRNGYANGPIEGGLQSGNQLRIIFKNPIDDIFTPQAARIVTEKGAKYLGENNDAVNLGDGELTDLSFLLKYFAAEDEAFSDGLQVISATELVEFLATPVIDPSEYRLAEARNHQGENTLRGRTTDDIIQGGNKDDIINVRGGDDIVIGGYGRDTITLNNNGAETIVYRFSSDGQWTAIDGADTVHNFERGVDEMVLVDVGGNPIDLATLLESEHKFDVSLYRSGNELNGIAIRFSNPGFADGPGSSNGSGKWLRVFFDESITLFNSDGSVTDEGAQLIGDDGSKYDAATNKLTDFSLLPYYFDGEFGEGLRVIAPNELGVDII